MNKVDLNNETVSKIVNSALELFNTNGYAGTSISDISKKAQLSKGILYHYFKNKDGLYLYCASLCIDRYIDYLNDKLQNPISKPDSLSENIKYRIQFFDENPKLKSLFMFIVTKKPAHLAEELIEIRKKMTENDVLRLKEARGSIKLGKGVTEADVLNLTAFVQSSSAFLFLENPTEEQRTERVDVIVRLAKIFINGLKEDLE